MEQQLIVPIINVVQQPERHVWPDDHDICVANAVHNITDIMNN
jgi:hypothetical protein